MLVEIEFSVATVNRVSKREKTDWIFSRRQQFVFVFLCLNRSTDAAFVQRHSDWLRSKVHSTKKKVIIESQCF